MVKKDLYVRLKEATTTIGVLRDVEISIDRIIYEEFEEPMGPTPMPSIRDLRSWDHILLKRYRPFYMPFCELCCLCTFGKCDLSMGKRGACGLDMAAQQSRIVLLACCIGASTHTSHAKHLVEYLIERYGRDSPIDLGEGVGVEAPITRLVTGIRPRTLRDLEDVLSYVDNQLIHLLASTHTGQEGNALDFESKVLHTGMLDHLAMEVADIAQISVMGFPKSDPDAPLVDLGFGTVDKSKPVIMVVGHNVPSAAGIIDYLIESGLLGQVEVTGLCCTAHDATRYNPRAKIIGPISWQVRYIRSGLPDVVVVDEQCIKTNLIDEARKVNAVFIATSEKNCQGLRDRTEDPVDEIVKDLVEGREDGVLIFDAEKVGEVAVKAA
ncbi:MAG: acetyl-CoA decarbonylase/synthase complex subunit alpha, partial [Candidatus Bathyarchaeia archaeon]